MTITVINSVNFNQIAIVKNDDYCVAAHEAKQAAIAAVQQNDIVAEAFSPMGRRLFRVARSNDFAGNGRIYISN